ncbi:MAG: hypothetical protein ABI606_15180, partial [Rhodoferax sp.]
TRMQALAAANIGLSAKGAIANKDQAGIDQWKEGGSARVALHAVVGGLTGSVQGAAGAAASSAVTPVLAENIVKLAIPDELKLTLVEGLGAVIGGVAGGTAGAVAGFNETTNNQATQLRAAMQLLEKAGRLGIENLGKAGTATLQACMTNATCSVLVPAGAAVWLAAQNNKVITQPSAADLIPTGYGAGVQPQPLGRLVTPAASTRRDAARPSLHRAVPVSDPGTASPSHAGRWCLQAK